MEADELLLLGRLTQSVETLTSEVMLLRTELDQLKDLRNTGKGILIGVALAASTIGAGIGATLTRWAMP